MKLWFSVLLAVLLALFFYLLPVPLPTVIRLAGPF